MLKRLREKLSVFTVRNPSLTILLAILILNIILFAVAALVISWLAPKSLPNTGFWPSVFYTISMILDAGCIEYVVSDIGEASVALIIVCLITVLIGMITFTGSVVGYVTNYISSFIENSKAGNRALKVSGHTIILNWNSRASEIVNDLLYTGKKETVVVLASQPANEIQQEIDERLSSTLKDESQQVKSESATMPAIKRFFYRKKHKLRDNVTVIIREGETYSTKQLNDISISQANSIILLTKEYQNEVCKYGNHERREGKFKHGQNSCSSCRDDFKRIIG